MTSLKLHNMLVTKKRLEQALEDVETKGVESSQGYLLLTHFYQSIDADRLPDPRVMSFLSKAFCRIIEKFHQEENINFPHELRMTRAQNRPKQTTISKIILANRYGGFVMDRVESKLLSENQAITEASKKFKLSERTIRRYLAIYKSELE